MSNNKVNAVVDLTLRQQQYVNFINGFMFKNKYPPTIKDMADYFKVNINASQSVIDALLKKGAITHDAGVARSIVVVSDDCSYCKCK